MFTAANDRTPTPLSSQIELLQFEAVISLNLARPNCIGCLTSGTGIYTHTLIECGSTQVPMSPAAAAAAAAAG